MSRILLQSGLAVAILAFVRPAVAAANASTLFGTETIPYDAYITGSFDIEQGQATAKASVLATIEDNHPSTISYDTVTYVTGALDFPVQTKSLSVQGGFEQRQLTLAVSLDPITLVASTTATPLVQTSGTLFMPAQLLDSSAFLHGQMLTGSYTITGPSEMASGRFSLPLDGAADDQAFTQVDVAGFPNTVTLSGGGTELSTTQTAGIFAGTVDGVQLQVGLSGPFLLDDARMPLTLVQVPEPSRLSLLLCSVVAGLTRSRTHASISRR